MKLFAAKKEEILVKRLRQGEKMAMRDFYTLYSGFLSAVCARYIGNDDDLKDVLQESLISVFTHVSTFKYMGEGSLKAWATRIVVNHSLMFLRADKHRNKLVSIDEIQEEGELDDPNIEEIPPGVIHEMIKKLPDGYRTVFNLYVFEDKSHKEISATLGIKEASSASQLHRAKNILARMINDYKNNRH